LDSVVLRLRDGEESDGGVAPRLVLVQQEGEQHQQSAIMHHPVDVDRAAKLQASHRTSMRLGMENLGMREQQLTFSDEGGNS
jgi:hypothetical protein